MKPFLKTRTVGAILPYPRRSFRSRREREEGVKSENDRPTHA